MFPRRFLCYPTVWVLRSSHHAQDPALIGKNRCISTSPNQRGDGALATLHGLRPKRAGSLALRLPACIQSATCIHETVLAYSSRHVSAVPMIRDLAVPQALRHSVHAPHTAFLQEFTHQFSECSTATNILTPKSPRPQLRPMVPDMPMMSFTRPNHFLSNVGAETSLRLRFPACPIWRRAHGAATQRKY